jgi:predicted secreted Zn-dependent protease
VVLLTSLNTEHYQVQGRTTEAIFDYIERNGPTDGEGKRGSGLTSVVWGYEWQGGPTDNRCVLRSMTIKADMEVTLPQHAEPAALPASIRMNWDAYAKSVAEHEQTHVDIYNAGAAALKQRMEAIGAQASCSQLETEIKRVWAEEQNRINQSQANFHKEEFDRLAARRAPIAAQIDANRTKINSLQRDIDGLSRRLADLRKQIDGLVAEINAIDDQIRAVNGSSDTPENKQAKLLVLVQQRNALNDRHSRAVDEYNGLLEDREALADQRDGLIATTNELVDQFNWTR